MKRLLIFMMLLGGVLMAKAQSDDVIIGGTDDIQYGSKVEVAGSNTLNTLLGVKVYEEDFCKHFLEYKLGVGNADLAFGFTYCYLPKKWGGYGSLMVGFLSGWFTGGVAYRLSSPKQTCDWQMFGGIAAGYSAGAELGLRLSSKVNENFGFSLSLLSGSFSVIVIPYGTMCTFGISLLL